jgi:hypothetical protein
MKTMMPEREPAVTNAAVKTLDPRRQSGTKGRARAEPAMKYRAATTAKRRAPAMKRRTSAAVKRRAAATMEATTTAVETATTAVETATATAATMTPTTAMASDFSRKCARSGFRCGQRTSAW